VSGRTIFSPQRSPGWFRADFSTPKGRGLWRRRYRRSAAIDPAPARQSADPLTIYRFTSTLLLDRSISSTWRRDYAPPPASRSPKKKCIVKHLFPDKPRLRPATAVKYEEVEQDVPSLPKLRKCASNVYSCEIIKKMELAGACDLPPTRRSPRAPNRIARFKQSNLLRHRRRRRVRSTDRDPPKPEPRHSAVLIELEWDLATVVSAHFLESVFAVTDGGTFPHDDVGDRHWTHQCAAQLQKLCCYLHSICLQDAHLAATATASKLAAAIIATGRLQLNIYPVWPNELAVAAGYQSDELGPIMSKILALYKEAMPAAHANNGEGMGYEMAGASDVDTVITAMPGSIQVHGGDMDDGVLCDGGKDGREFLTPSPTGPLDASGFFDEPMESSMGTAVYC